MSTTTARLIGMGLLTGALLVTAWAKGALAGGRAHRKAAERFAARTGLPAEAVDDQLARRVVRRHRLVVVGFWAGLVTASLLGTSWALGYVGLAFGAVADRLLGHPAAPNAPRTAHGRDTRITDYVPGWLLAAVGLAVLCAGTLAVCWAAAPRLPRDASHYDLPPEQSVGLVVWLVAGAAGSAALTRLVVHRAQPVASAAELAVDDALRSQAVRDALHLATAAAAATALAFATALNAQAADSSLRAVAGWTPTAFLVALAVVGTWHEAVRGPAYWRSRLHPEPAATR